MTKMQELIVKRDELSHPEVLLSAQIRNLNEQIGILDKQRREAENKVWKEKCQIDTLLYDEIIKHLIVTPIERPDTIRGINSVLLKIEIKVDEEVLKFREKKDCGGYVYRYINGKLSEGGGGGRVVLKALHEYFNTGDDKEYEWRRVAEAEKQIAENELVYGRSFEIDLSKVERLIS